MNPLDQIPSLQAAAAIMLPGLRHARALLDVSIRVLEYFDRHATRDAASKTSSTFPPPSPKFAKEVENMKSMLSTFERLHEKRS